MTISIDLSELGGLADALRKDPIAVALGAHTATMAVGAELQAKAQGAAPRDRPWLATDGIRRKTWRDASGTHVDVFTVPDPEGRPVGVFVEYGTSVMPPQPFLVIQSAWAETALPTAIEQKVNPLA